MFGYCHSQLVDRYVRAISKHIHCRDNNITCVQNAGFDLRSHGGFPERSSLALALSKSSLLQNILLKIKIQPL